MSKKQRMTLELCIIDNEQYVYIKENEEYRSADILVKYLDSCKRKKEISNGRKIYGNETIQYIYDITDDSDKYSFVVKVKNSDKKLHNTTIKYMDTLCDLSATVKKANRARVAAGLFAGAFVIVAAGPSIIKEYEKRNDAKIEHQQELYEEFLEKTNNQKYYEPTFEEKQQAEDKYYEDLRNKAEKGDKEALKEYQAYLLEQLVLEQKEAETTKTR